MTDQARTPTTEALVVKLNLTSQAALIEGYIVYADTMAEAAAALLAAEQLEQALREALTDLMQQWGADVEGCLACAALDNDAPCETCMQTVRCSGALEGTIRRVLAATSEPPATGEQP